MRISDWSSDVCSSDLGDAGAARAEERVHLVEEDDDWHVLGSLLLGLDEDLADLPLGLADVLVEELGALDVEEEALDLLAALFGDQIGRWSCRGGVCRYVEIRGVAD